MRIKFVIAVVIAVMAGWYAALLWQRAQHGDKQRNNASYQCPMHPWVKLDKPGRCTVCGMDLVRTDEGGQTLVHMATNIVMLPQGSPNVIGVQTSEVSKRQLLRTLRVSGVIGEQETRHSVISAPVEGRLDGLAMNCEGQQVARREPIATIFSRTLLAAANDYKLALDKGGPALEQAKRRLEQYGLVWEQIKAIPDRQPDDIYFGVLSPLTGTIVKSYVNEGQYVKEGEKLFEIADFTTMWFTFPVYEQDLPFIKQRQVISVQIPSLSGPPINARVGFISPDLDEATRSAKVRVVIENPERRIKNHSYAEGMIKIEEPDVLAVARTAVLCSGNVPRVYVEKQAGVYEQRSVKVGRCGDADWEVLEGLKEGERVVTSANMLIDGQAQLDQAAQQP